jgi:hypothetical protein
MTKSKLWKSDDLATEIKNYIESRADLKSWPPLTPALLKTFPGFENHTDEAAEYTLKCYETLLPVLVAYNPEVKIILIDNQQVVNCIQEIEPLKIAA